MDRISQSKKQPCILMQCARKHGDRSRIRKHGDRSRIENVVDEYIFRFVIRIRDSVPDPVVVIRYLTPLLIVV